METVPSQSLAVGEIPAYRVRNHGLQLGEGIALRGDATADRIVPTGNETARLGTGATENVISTKARQHEAGAPRRSRR